MADRTPAEIIALFRMPFGEYNLELAKVFGNESTLETACTLFADALREEREAQQHHEVQLRQTAAARYRLYPTFQISPMLYSQGTQQMFSVRMKPPISWMSPAAAKLLELSLEPEHTLVPGLVSYLPENTLPAVRSILNQAGYTEGTIA